MKYGTYRDFRANKKEPLSDSLVINYNRFCSFFINGSFSDAKIPKDIPQHLITRNLSHDASQMVNRLADILCSQIRRQSGVEAFAHAPKRSAGVGKGLDMALVGYEGGVAVRKKITLRIGEMGTQITDS